jgi:hypothetical protein
MQVQPQGLGHPLASSIVKDAGLDASWTGPLLAHASAN